MKNIAARRRPAVRRPSAPVRTKTKWTQEMDNRLGKTSDAELAKELGVWTSAVRLRRVKLGIPVYTENKWLPRHIHLLGKISDRDLAKQVGVTPGAVFHMRTRHGIPAAPARERQGLADEFKAMLGVKNDSEVASLSGYSLKYICTLRNSLNIKPAPRVKNNIEGGDIYKAFSLAVTLNNHDAIAALYAIRARLGSNAAAIEYALLAVDTEKLPSTTS